VATRRRGGADLDDLKSRLGLADDAPSSDGPSSDGPESESRDEVLDGESPADSESAAPGTPSSPPSALAAPAAPRPAPQAAAPRPAAPRPAAPAADEDEGRFAAAQSEEIAEISFDPNAYDPSLKIPGQRTGMVVGVAALVALVLGLGVGGVLALGTDGRRVHNERIADAQRVMSRLDPIARKLLELNGRIQPLPAEATFSEEFQQVLAAAYSDGAPVFDGTSLVAAGHVLATDPRATGALLTFAIRTAQLRDLVQQHLQLSAADADSIRRELDGTLDSANYAIMYDFLGAVNAYNGTQQDPPVPFMPQRAERVTYQSLEMGEMPGAPEIPAVTVTAANGETGPIPAFNVLILPREQLLPALTSETPLSRYRQRAVRIKEVVNDLAVSQQPMLEQIRLMAETDTIWSL
jgi:hypothetical protein